jgi:hypothetical protein
MHYKESQLTVSYDCLDIFAVCYAVLTLIVSVFAFLTALLGTVIGASG